MTDFVKSNGNNSMAKQETRRAVEYVAVGESEDGDKMELPTQPEDGTLSLATLTHAFPGAHGLKYRNPSTGASRALLLDSSGTRFVPPADGWENKSFVVIFPQRATGDQNAKRKKMMDDYEGESDSEDYAGGRGLMKQKRFDKPHEKICTDLIVLGIPYKTSSDTVKAYFETFGDVVMFDLKVDASGNSKGFGFVRMKDYDAQLRVLAKSVHDIEGRRCQVRIPLSKGEVAPSVNTRIFVGRLPERITSDDLREFFNVEAKKYDPEATVTDIFIPRPFRSFAFVNFTSPVAASEIIKLGDVVVCGSSLAVSAAAPRDNPALSYRSSQRGSFGVPTTPGLPFPSGTSVPPLRFESYSSEPNQGSFYESYNGGAQWNSPRGGATFRGMEGRGPNRYSNPGFNTSSPSAGGVPPSRSAAGQALASGLDALNLNKMNVNPDMMDAAWQAFWTTLGGQQGNVPPPPQPATQKWQ